MLEVGGWGGGRWRGRGANQNTITENRQAKRKAKQSKAIPITFTALEQSTRHQTQLQSHSNQDTDREWHTHTCRISPTQVCQLSLSKHSKHSLRKRLLQTANASCEAATRCPRHSEHRFPATSSKCLANFCPLQGTKVREGEGQTPNTGLRHLSFSHCRHSVQKTVSERAFFCWCSNSSKFVTNNSDYIRRLFYNSSCYLRQLKSNQNRLNRDGTLLLLFYPGWMRLIFTCVPGR